MLAEANRASPFTQSVAPGVDQITSQTNYSDLLASQSSSAALSAAYQRSQSRCIESLSRNVTPTSSQSSQSSYYTDCPTPTSPTFPLTPLSAPPQQASFGCGYPYGDQTPNLFPNTPVDYQGWPGCQAEVYPSNGYQAHLRRFNSI